MVLLKSNLTVLDLMLIKHLHSNMVLLKSFTENGLIYDDSNLHSNMVLLKFRCCYSNNNGFSSFTFQYGTT